MAKFLSNTKMFLIMSLTMGLAPFTPEPHIWGKIKWMAGGAVGMGPMDWFDVFLHGTPWVLLIASLIYQSIIKFKKRKQSSMPYSL